tara:strand:- start:91 stop:375 length:285 start_codon:yes stop_codon:yes gene_type:complete
MNINKSLVEFLGTYIALFLIYYSANKFPKYIAPVVGFAFFIVVFLFSEISGNFNPAITFMFVCAKKQPKTDLVTLVIPQLLGAYLALCTFKFIN